MKRSNQSVPIFVSAGVIIFVCILQSLPHIGSAKKITKPSQPQPTQHGEWDFFDRLEWILYDLRVKLAARMQPPAQTNLGAVVIEESSIATVASDAYQRPYGLLWPRDVYGYLVRQLTEEGAKTVAFDILFSELRADQNHLTTNTLGLTPDQYFARELNHASNVILAVTRDVVPANLFRTNAWASGDITAEQDSDGVLRRAKAFRDYVWWHPAIEKLVKPLSLDLTKAIIETNRIRIPIENDEASWEVPLNPDGSLNLGELGENSVTPVPPAVQVRVWHMGIVLAASELQLDLPNAEVRKDRIILRGPNQIQRTIPIDADGYFHIDWTFTFRDPRLTHERIERVLDREYNRSRGHKDPPPDIDWKNKLVIVGSTVTGGNVSDTGATPLESSTFLMSVHWNIANSVLMDRFIRRSAYGTETFLIVLMGILAAALTWRLTVLWASFWVVMVTALYLALAAFLFVQYRYWLPIVLPIAGALLINHTSLLTYRVFFEQREGSRVKSVFAKVVAPDVMNELLGAESFSLGGARREVTVLFADLRGFTEFTELSQANAEETVRVRKLNDDEAERHFDEQATAALNTVNDYLTLIVEMVIQHKGTFDKYIGDCVMAFWGAPLPNEHHALSCVRAAIAAQRAMDQLNQERKVENARRTEENTTRIENSQEPLPLLPILAFGTGINTGKVTVGVMGSDAHQFNYTVFGREVNLASRLESVSGTARIIISEATFKAVQRDDAALASQCIERAPVSVKGFRKPVRIYEVPWREGQQETQVVPQTLPDSPPTAAA